MEEREVPEHNGTSRDRKSVACGRRAWRCRTSDTQGRAGAGVGGRGSLQTYEKSVYNAVVALAHSAAIKQKVFRVGTTSEMDMGYNHGLSSWTRTCCLVYEDGTKQLINFIPNGKGGYSYHV